MSDAEDAVKWVQVFCDLYKSKLDAVSITNRAYRKYSGTRKKMAAAVCASEYHNFELERDRALLQFMRDMGVTGSVRVIDIARVFGFLSIVLDRKNNDPSHFGYVALNWLIRRGWIQMGDGRLEITKRGLEALKEIK